MNRPGIEPKGIEDVEAAAAEQLAETYEELAGAEALVDAGPGEGSEPESDDLELLAELEGAVPPAIVPDAELTPGEAPVFVMPFDEEVQLLPRHVDAWMTDEDDEAADARLRGESEDLPA